MQQPENYNLEPKSSVLGPVSSTSLLDYLLVIAKYKKMIFLTTSSASLLTALIMLTIPNIYTAKAMIIPSDDDKGAMGALMAQMGGLAGLAGGAVGSKSTSELYITMLKSETVKDPLIDRFKLLEVYKAKLRADVYSVLDKKVLVSLGKKDGVITISVEDKDPKRAADMANAYVYELGKLASGLNMTGAGNNRLFLEKRITKARTDLSRAEEALKEFQSKNKAISVTDQAKATIEGIVQLRAQLAIQEVQLGTLQRQFTETSQEVKTTKAMVANLRTQIGQLEGKGSGGSSSIPNVGNMPQLGQDYLRLMRDFKIQEAVVEMLTKQYEVSQLNEVKDITPFQVLQKAKPPEKKTKPTRRKKVQAAMLLSFIGSCILALILENIQQMPATKKARWKSLIGKN